MQIVPRRDAPVLLVVAQARVHQDAPRRRLHHEAVDAHAQPAIVVGEVRPQPGDRLDGLACRLRQDEAAPAGDLEFHHLGHRHVADPPRIVRFLVPRVPAYHDCRAVGGHRLGPAHRLLRFAELAVDASRCRAHRGAGGEAWRLDAHLPGGLRHHLPGLRRAAAAEARAAAPGLPADGAAPLARLPRRADQHPAEALPIQRGAVRRRASSRCARPRATHPRSNWRTACCARCGRTN